MTKGECVKYQNFNDIITQIDGSDDILASMK